MATFLKGKAIIRDSWIDTVWIGGPGVVLFLLLRQLFPINVVPTPSMEPTIKADERVLVNKLSQSPQRGDLVQFDTGFRYGLGDREAVRFIKRVVAIPGDTVAIESGQLVVNGVVIEEDYATAATEDYPMVKVPADHYFVLGDNREKSYDSRFLGAIEADQIEGQVILIF
jgi:signal peptidase I